MLNWAHNTKNVFTIHKSTGLGYRDIDFRKVDFLFSVLNQYKRHKQSGYDILSQTPSDLLTADMLVVLHSWYSLIDEKKDEKEFLSNPEVRKYVRKAKDETKVSKGKSSFYGYTGVYIHSDDSSAIFDA